MEEYHDSLLYSSKSSYPIQYISDIPRSNKFLDGTLGHRSNARGLVD